MGGLSAFLQQNAIKPDNVKIVVSKRFVDEKGNPLEWEIKCIDTMEDELLRKSCMKKVPVPNTRNQFVTETDYNLYLGKLMASCTVYPNLNDAELQNSYGVMGSDAVLKKMLTAGEYAAFLLEVQDVNGFNKDYKELVDEAKN